VQLWAALSELYPAKQGAAMLGGLGAAKDYCSTMDLTTQVLNIQGVDKSLEASGRRILVDCRDAFAQQYFRLVELRKNA
jgi:hypothetical protein